MLLLNSKMLNKEQSVQTSLLFMIIITLNTLFFVGNMISVQASTGTSSDTGSNGRSISNGTSIADQEESRLMNELVKTGKFTKDEAREFVTKVMLMNELVKTGKFTKDEAREFVTKVMKNGTDGTNVTAGSKAPVPEANLSANVPVPEANLSANVPVPEANLSANVPVPEANLSANVPVPEANIPQNNNSGLVKLDIGVKQNPISPGEEQTVTLTASDPITGEPIDRIFVHLTIKGPSGNIVKDYTDNDGKLSPTFVIGENDVGTFTILGTALQAGVESRKSLTFQVQ
jgi:polyhydroxyalkanoate synthesis regulator phasin